MGSGFFHQKLVQLFTFFILFGLVHLGYGQGGQQFSGMIKARDKQRLEKIIASLVLGNEDWEEYCDIDFLTLKKPIVELKSIPYGLPADSVNYILCYEYLDSLVSTYKYGISKDKVQDDWASQRMLPLGLSKFIPEAQPVATQAGFSDIYNNKESKIQKSERIAKEDLRYFYEVLNKNRYLEYKGQLPDNAPRNGKDHWIFSTIGIAQLGIFTALELAIEGYILDKRVVQRFKDADGVWNLNNVAETLSIDPHASIEILFAELKKAKTVYSDILNYDISYSFSTFLQLHRMGYFKYHALQRCNGEKETQLAKDVVDCSETYEQSR